MSDFSAYEYRQVGRRIEPDATPNRGVAQATRPSHSRREPSPLVTSSLGLVASHASHLGWLANHYHAVIDAGRSVTGPQTSAKNRQGTVRGRDGGLRARDLDAKGQRPSDVSFI